MPNKPSDPKIHPLSVAGTLIMVADLVALVYWALVIREPMVIALKADGRWTFWDEAIDKLIAILFWVVACLGCTIAVLPDNEWDWKRAAQSVLEELIPAVIVGSLYAVMSNR